MQQKTIESGAICRGIKKLLNLIETVHSASYFCKQKQICFEMTEQKKRNEKTEKKNRICLFRTRR